LRCFSKEALSGSGREARPRVGRGTRKRTVCDWRPAHVRRLCAATLGGAVPKRKLGWREVGREGRGTRSLRHKEPKLVSLFPTRLGKEAMPHQHATWHSRVRRLRGGRDTGHTKRGARSNFRGPRTLPRSRGRCPPTARHCPPGQYPPSRPVVARRVLQTPIWEMPNHFCVGGCGCIDGQR